jgi:hypothetical protein
VGYDITQAEALLALIEPGALLELCTFAANPIRLDAHFDAAFRSALIGHRAPCRAIFAQRERFK